MFSDLRNTETQPKKALSPLAQYVTTALLNTLLKAYSIEKKTN